MSEDVQRIAAQTEALMRLPPSERAIVEWLARPDSEGLALDALLDGQATEGDIAEYLSKPIEEIDAELEAAGFTPEMLAEFNKRIDNIIEEATP